MKIGSIFIIIVLSLLPTKVVCSDENTTNYDALISLKNNEEIKVQIIAFHSWGLSIQEELTVNYQVIESITTYDSSHLSKTFEKIT